MMSISTIAGDAGYYASQDNYYVLGSLESRWMGKGAEALGLSGQVPDAEMNAMKKGILPDGTVLSRVENGKETHRPGYDLTFSAPKSVSMLALIGGDRRFIDAHNRAVGTAMKEVEALSSARITEGGHTQTVLTGNIVAALYTHDTSRDLDPAVHTHALVFNATEAEGKWRALASDTKMKTGFSETIYANQIALGKIYQHSLRQDVEKMGFETRDAGKNGLWEIKDVPVEPFSQRHNAIVAAVGADAPRHVRDVAALDTRKAKVTSDPLVLVAEWNDRLKETGFNLPDFVGRAKAREVRGADISEAAGVAPDMATAIGNAISTLSDSKVQFTYSDMLAKTASQLPAEPGLFARVRDGIDAAIEQQRLIPLDKEKGIFTSDIHLLNELSVHTLAQTAMQENRVLSFPGRAVERSRSYADAYSVLSQDKSAVAILSGRGGATQLRDRVTDAAIMAGENGRDVVVLAADNRGRDFLSLDPQLAGKVMSRSALTADLTLPLPPQSTLVVAQAEKLSLKETLLILEKGQARGVQMLFIDSENRTGTGNALSVLKDAGVPQYRFYDGNKTLTTVVSESDKRQRHDRLAQDYAAFKAEGQPVVAQASGPREQALLNTAIRAELQASGQLGKDERQVSVIQPVWLDGKTRNQRDTYRAGMVMEQWDKDTKTMTRYSVDRVTESTNTLRLVSETGEVRVEKISGLDSSWSAFANKTLPVAIGEPLMAVGRELEGTIKARDGLTVTGFNDGGVVVSKGDATLVLETSRALKLASPLVEGLGASVSDKQIVLAATDARDLNAAALNQLSRSGGQARLYTALPQDRAEKRLASNPNFRVASEQVKAQAGEANLDAAMLKNRDALHTPVAQSVALGLSRAQSQSIAFSKANLISASLGWSPDVTVSQAGAEIDRQVKSGDLISLSPVAGAGSGLIVPRVTYEMEKSIIRTVAEGKNAVAPLMDTVPDKYLSGLTGSQQAATRLILESPDRFVAIQGYAGTGKTTQFKAVMAALDSLPEGQRPEVIGLAPTHRAVHEMQSVGVRSQTLSSFLSEERQKNLAGEKTDYGSTLFLVDESSMVGNRDMAELYQRIADTGGRAINSGDVAQLQPIEPGQPFRLLQSRSPVDTAVMQDIVRQTPELRAAVYSMIEGDVRGALEKTEAVSPAQVPRKAGAWVPSSSVMEFKTAREAASDSLPVQATGDLLPAEPSNVIEAITRDFTGRTKDVQAQTIIVTDLNADRRDINSLIHDALHKDGELGKDELTLTVLVPARVPDKALRSAAGFTDHVGHVAVMNNQHMTVSFVDTAQGLVTLTDETGKPTLISNFQNSTQDISLYVPREITVSAGDRMRFTRSDNERGFVANSAWQVSRVESSGRLTLTDGEREKLLEPGRVPEDGHIDLAYAVTTSGAQGANAFYSITLSGTEGGRKNMATLESAYVGGSRHKEHHQSYTDDREGWLKQLDRQAERHSAHDLLHHDADRAAQVAERLLSTATPLADTALGRKLLQTSGLDTGESMAKFIAPGKKYPQPHIALPVWDSNGRRAGVYLDEVRNMSQGGGAWLDGAPRVMGGDDARFAGLQVSRNGDTHVAGSMPEGLALAHQHPDSGVLVRLSGEGAPHNLARITGSRLATDEDVLRQAQRPDDEPLPFIPPEDEKKQAELEKSAQAAAALPEEEKVRLASEAARAELAASAPDVDGKALSEAAKMRTELPDVAKDGAVLQVAAQERAATRLQQMEREIVIEKTFGE